MSFELAARLPFNFKRVYDRKECVRSYRRPTPDPVKDDKMVEKEEQDK